MNTHHLNRFHINKREIESIKVAKGAIHRMFQYREFPIVQVLRIRVVSMRFLTLTLTIHEIINRYIALHCLAVIFNAEKRKLKCLLTTDV